MWLDSGAFSGEASVAGRFQTETLLEGMNRLGYAAANVTDRELADGMENFLEVARLAKFPLISANVVFQDSGRSILPPFTIRRLPPEAWRGETELRIGILGLAREAPGFLETTESGAKVIVAAPIPAAARWVPIIAQDADMVVVLTNMAPNDVNRMIRQVEGIDLVLAGRGARVSDNVAVAPNTRVLYAGNHGKRAGEVRVFLRRQGVGNVVAKHLFLDRRYPTDPEMEKHEAEGNARINDYYRKQAEETPVNQVTGLPTSSRFLGADACRTCHVQAQETWEASGHSTAIQTLIEAGQEFSPLCVKCHVTGFHKANGFQNLKATPEFAGVQCEQCHGAGAAHLDNPSLPYGKTDSSGCLVCHTPENSPEFEFGPYWEQIRH